jgi:hypothetical protein
MVAKTNRWGACGSGEATLAAVGLQMLMMLVVDVQTAEATFPGKNGKIAYLGLRRARPRESVRRSSQVTIGCSH